MKELFDALYTFVTTDDDAESFNDDIGGRITYGEAIEGCDYPYAVFHVTSFEDLSTFTEKISSINFQINICNDECDYTLLMDLISEIGALLDELILTISGYRDATIIKILDVPPTKDKESKEWMAAVEFNIMIQEE